MIEIENSRTIKRRFRDKFQEMREERQSGPEGYGLDPAAYNADLAVNALASLLGDFREELREGRITTKHYLGMAEEIAKRDAIIRSKRPFRRLSERFRG